MRGRQCRHDRAGCDIARSQARHRPLTAASVARDVLRCDATERLHVGRNTRQLTRGEGRARHLGAADAPTNNVDERLIIGRAPQSWLRQIRPSAAIPLRPVAAAAQALVEPLALLQVGRLGRDDRHNSEYDDQEDCAGVSLV